MNLSLTSKSSTFWKLAVPTTVKFLPTTKSCVIEISLAKVTSPAVTEKLLSENEAIPLLDELAT